MQRVNAVDRNFLVLLSNKLNDLFDIEFSRRYYTIIVNTVKIFQLKARRSGITVTLQEVYVLFENIALLFIHIVTRFVRCVTLID